MSTELIDARKYPLRKRSMYNDASSIALRIIEYTDGAYEFKNPFIPVAILDFNQMDEPMTGMTGPDLENIFLMTDDFSGDTGFEIFGIDGNRMIDYPSLLWFYSMLQAEGDELTTDDMIALAKNIPDEVWYDAQDAEAGSDPGTLRMLILEKR